MKIVVLLGGVGARFAQVGYEKPKPFIRVDGKTMLEHVVTMYPGDNEFLFVCNSDFVETDALLSLAASLPRARILSIPPHKLGPVHTLSYAWDELSDDEPVMVSYCDFSAHWDFADFAQKVASSKWDGAIPSYTGFHPHLLHRKKYAGIIADSEGAVQKIQEKHSFTENPEDSFHSAGNYYFSRAGELKQYAQALVESGVTLNGEYYLSMVYYHYLADGKNILVYPLKHFMQWGTPEDLEEYEAWSRLVQGKDKGITDIPPSREQYVRIPHAIGSKEYEASLAYWRNYFSR